MIPFTIINQKGASNKFMLEIFSLVWYLFFNHFLTLKEYYGNKYFNSYSLAFSLVNHNLVSFYYSWLLNTFYEHLFFISAKQLKTNKLKYTMKLYLVKMIVKANKLVYKVNNQKMQLKDVFMNNLLFTLFVAKKYTAK